MKNVSVLSSLSTYGVWGFTDTWHRLLCSVSFKGVIGCLGQVPSLGAGHQVPPAVTVWHALLPCDSAHLSANGGASARLWARALWWMQIRGKQLGNSGAGKTHPKVRGCWGRQVWSHLRALDLRREWRFWGVWVSRLCQQHSPKVAHLGLREQEICK